MLANGWRSGAGRCRRRELATTTTSELAAMPSPAAQAARRRARRAAQRAGCSRRPRRCSGGLWPPAAAHARWCPRTPRSRCPPPAAPPRSDARRLRPRPSARRRRRPARLRRRAAAQERAYGRTPSRVCRGLVGGGMIWIKRECGASSAWCPEVAIQFRLASTRIHAGFACRSARMPIKHSRHAIRLGGRYEPDSSSPSALTAEAVVGDICRAGEARSDEAIAMRCHPH